MSTDLAAPKRHPLRDRAVGKRWFEMLTQDAGLKPAGSVLDVGCGRGRIAETLVGYLTGRYEGFDVDADAVRWCDENITPKAPNFRFKVAALHNTLYNPEGKAAA